ncbi:hypothetical protein GOP47_0010300 [Adiantum capillus-veneris]|uniref:WRKY domain-containing protein n=1 Tax=Adiantum capillus-veneris TaxID=13818 RepID=A0A9D4UV40_ADICA|nr:hypothetical protein GOP47_0010300 [Adiantum capillus-veneris]
MLVHVQAVHEDEPRDRGREILELAMLSKVGGRFDTQCTHSPSLPLPFSSSQLQMMREAGVAAALAKADTLPPALTISPKNPSDVFVRGGSENLSSSPMTLFSTFFGDSDPFTGSKLFSDSLAGILPSTNFFNSGGELPLFNSLGAMDALACSGSCTRDWIVNAQEQNLSKLNANYKSMMPSRLPILSTSTYLTIPPGLSPTTLLESPVFLNSELFDSSLPTSSLYSAAKTELMHSSAVVEAVNREDTTFKQQGSFGSSHNPGDGAMVPQLVSVPPDSMSQLASSQGPTSVQAHGLLQNGSKHQNSPESAFPNCRISDAPPQCISERTAIDGYNWKKYGQKQLKGTEFPRSYYKCTHPNCPVKKQVECSHQGEITEILYKGKHNHAKPQALRRGARTGGQSLVHENKVEASAVVSKTESDRFSTELSSSSLVGGLAGTPEQSFGSPSMEEGEDEGDGDDEQDSKRRRIEDFRETLSSAPIRTIREPRVVVQTTSEVDILDDGYRWRKYGQKVVKGNRFPRSYYKCTNIGCVVRKHVERSSTDPTSVMTAYEGKHNHNVPAARGSAREANGASAGPLPFASFAAMGLSSTQRPPISNEAQELGSLADKSFKGSTRFDVSSSNPIAPNMERNGSEVLATSSKMLGRGMGFDFCLLKRLGIGGTHGQDLGSSFFQPVYSSSSPSCVAEGHLSAGT